MNLNEKFTFLLNRILILGGKKSISFLAFFLILMFAHIAHINFSSNSHGDHFRMHGSLSLGIQELTYPFINQTP